MGPIQAGLLLSPPERPRTLLNIPCSRVMGNSSHGPLSSNRLWTAPPSAKARQEPEATQAISKERSLELPCRQLLVRRALQWPLKMHRCKSFAFLQADFRNHRRRM